jgi:hypothetical protein
MLTMWQPLSAKVATNFTDKRRSLGRYTSFADSGHGFSFFVFQRELGSSPLGYGLDDWDSIPGKGILFFRIMKSRRMTWKKHVARMEENRNAYRLMEGKPEGKRSLGRPRQKWTENIKTELVEVGWGDVDWIGLAQDRNRWRAVVNSAINLRAP